MMRSDVVDNLKITNKKSTDYILQTKSNI